MAVRKIEKVSEKYHILLCIFLLAILGMLRMHLAVKSMTSGTDGDLVFLSPWGQSEGGNKQFVSYLFFFLTRKVSFYIKKDSVIHLHNFQVRNFGSKRNAFDTCEKLMIKSA